MWAEKRKVHSVGFCSAWPVLSGHWQAKENASIASLGKVSREFPSLPGKGCPQLRFPICEGRMAGKTWSDLATFTQSMLQYPHPIYLLR